MVDVKFAVCMDAIRAFERANEDTLRKVAALQNLTYELDLNDVHHDDSEGGWFETTSDGRTQVIIDLLFEAAHDYWCNGVSADMVVGALLISFEAIKESDDLI